MDTSDESLRKLAWVGQIPVVIRLHKDDLASTQPPEDYFMLLPRMSLLPLWTEPIKEHFRPYVSVVGDDIWFDYGKTPLRTHYPIGVLFDLHCGCYQIPWVLNVHFQGFPDELIPFRTIEDIRDFYTNAVKESDYLKHGSTKRIMALPVEQQTQLWDSFRKMKFKEFWDVNQDIFIDKSASDIKFIPMRIYIKGRPFIQEPISPIDSHKREKTLRRALAEIFPSHFATEDENISEFGTIEPTQGNTAFVEPSTAIETRPHTNTSPTSTGEQIAKSPRGPNPSSLSSGTPTGPTANTNTTSTTANTNTTPLSMSIPPIRSSPDEGNEPESESQSLARSIAAQRANKSAAPSTLATASLMGSSLASVSSPSLIPQSLGQSNTTSSDEATRRTSSSTTNPSTSITSATLTGQNWASSATMQRTAQGTIRKIQAHSAVGSGSLAFQPVVVVQGALVDLEMPLKWLSEQASHPDNFLHVCLVDPQLHHPLSQ